MGADAAQPRQPQATSRRATAAASVLREVTLGVAAGDRIGVVGRNGDGKSTLLRLIAGVEAPDAGAVTRPRGAEAALLGQGDELDDAGTIREELVGGRADHEWAGDAAVPRGARRAARRRRARPLRERHGHADRRRCRAASGGGSRSRSCCSTRPSCCCSTSRPTTSTSRASTGSPRHLAARRGAMLVVTHDRWFLDAVCTATWEVADGGVHQYEGGYAAYVLARAERDRPGRGARRAPPQPAAQGARVAAPRAAGAHVQAEVPHRGRQRADRRRARAARPRRAAALRRRAARRQGARRGRRLRRVRRAGACCDDVTWRLGPGDRVALVGVNGSGKTTLLRLLAGELAPADAGVVERGATVRLAQLSQDTAEIPGHLRVLESLEAVRGARDAERRPGDHRGAALRPLRLPRRPAPARSSATSPAASGAGCSSCAC